MGEYFNQISGYFEAVPLWPFISFGFIGIIAGFIEILNRKRRADAIENFRFTIESELSSMYPKPINWPRNINHYLCSRLPEMQHNFEVLRVFMPQDHLLGYNTAWNNYCDFCRTITDEKLAAAEQSSAHESDPRQPIRNNEPDPKVVFHKLVSDLLEYTKLP